MAKMCETQVYPAVVHDQPLLGPADELRHWFAVYIIRNHEKRVAEKLHAKGVEAFLPLFTELKRWKNQTTAKVQSPLFPGYVFARFAGAERIRVLEIPSVVMIIGNGRELLPLPDSEIETLRKGLHLRQVDPYPYLKVGNRARIRSGPLLGLEGIVVRKDDRLRIVLSLDLIKRSVAVHVNADELESC
jgi:transcription antitermination factor NusG